MAVARCGRHADTTERVFRCTPRSARGELRHGLAQLFQPEKTRSQSRDFQASKSVRIAGIALHRRSWIRRGGPLFNRRRWSTFRPALTPARLFGTQ